MEALIRIKLSFLTIFAVLIPMHIHSMEQTKNQKWPALCVTSATFNEVNHWKKKLKKGIDDIIFNGEKKYSNEDKISFIENLLISRKPKDSLVRDVVSSKDKRGLQELSRGIKAICIPQKKRFHTHAVAKLPDPSHKKKKITVGALVVALHLDGQWAARLLIKHGAAIDETTKLGTALSIAARKGFKRIVRQLLKRNVNVNELILHGPDPLSGAIRSGCRRTARELIKHGTNVNVCYTDQFGNTTTPLIQAARNGDFKLTQILIEEGANLETPDNNGRTPLFNAVHYEWQTITELLLEKGAKPDTPDKHGTTPLMQAIMLPHAHLTLSLLMRGANVHAKDKDNKTVFDCHPGHILTALLELHANRH